MIADHLESATIQRLWLLLDASRSFTIPVTLEAFGARRECLFSGDTQKDYADVAPCLVDVTEHDSVWQWFCDEGLGNDWGIIVRSALPSDQLRIHFKKFLKCEFLGETGVFFKFYRPSVWRTFVPAFQESELSRMMEDLTEVFAEGAVYSGSVKRYVFAQQGLQIMDSRVERIVSNNAPVAARTAIRMEA
jgi:hypothetical protein